MTTVGPIEVGFIGLGNMGRPMAERLVAPGIRLHVYDRNAEALAKLTTREPSGMNRQSRWPTPPPLSSLACPPP